MQSVGQRFGNTKIAKAMALLLLVLTILLQGVASSAFAVDNHAHHHDHATTGGDCDTQAVQMDHAGHTAPEHTTQDNGSSSKNVPHCTPSMCCFHETFTVTQPVAVALLLPTRRVFDSGTVLASGPHTPQDRPPQII